MNVALVIYGSLDTLSGGYLYDRMLVAHLRAEGHAVEILSLPWRSYARHLGDNLSRGWFARLRGCRADVIIQDELNHPSLAWTNGRLRSAGSPPLVALCHHLRSSEEHPAPLLPLYRAVERRFLRTVDGCIYNSRTTQAAVEALAGITPPSVVALPSGTHLSLPDYLSLRAIVSAREEASAVQMLFVGNLAPRKQLHSVLEAVARLRFPAHLHVVGAASDRRYAQAIHRQIVRLQLEERVTLHGRVADAQLRRLYALCHLFVLPSYEGFGIVYLEAMAYGLPVIAASAGAAHEVVAHGETGFLVHPGAGEELAQRISQLAEDRALRLAMGKAGRARFESFPSWEQSCARIVTFLHTMVG